MTRTICVLVFAILLIASLPGSFVSAQTEVNEISAYHPSAAMSDQNALASSTSILLLSQKVNLLAEINDRTLNSVYWTLGVLATIFLAIVGLNIFFNTSAFRRDLENIKDQAQKESQSQILSAENRIFVKLEAETNTQIKRVSKDIKSTTAAQITAAREQIKLEVSNVSQKEIETQMGKTYAELRNEVLEAKASLLKEVGAISLENSELRSKIKSIKETMDEMNIEITELQAFKYHKQDKMGGILNLFEVLKYDVEKRKWHIKHTLADINNVLDEYVGSLKEEQIKSYLKILENVPEEGNLEVLTEIRQIFNKKSPAQ